jgi:hypothetical protein
MDALLPLISWTRLERERRESRLTRQVYWALRGKETARRAIAASYLPAGYRVCRKALGKFGSRLNKAGLQASG